MVRNSIRLQISHTIYLTITDLRRLPPPLPLQLQQPAEPWMAFLRESSDDIPLYFNLTVMKFV